MDAILNTIEEANTTDELSESDQTYLHFRRVVEPGLVSVGFDMTPAKSKAYTNSRTGKPYTDQTLRSHILNGAAFAARVNYALEQLGSRNALTQSELLKAMALFAVHDLHKTRTAQKRAVENPSERDDPAMDISLPEVTSIVEDLRLKELDTGLDIPDYQASAHGAEQRRGLHRETLTRTFVGLREWVRLMDSAASNTSPTAATDGVLASRVSSIDPTITLHYHRIDDTKGVTTNLLNKTICEKLSDSPDVEPVVHFHNGTIYAAKADLPVDETPNGNLPTHLKQSLASEFVTTVRSSRDVFDDAGEVESGVVDQNISKGYLNVSRSTYLTSGLGTAFEAVRGFIETKAGYGPDRYSVYEKGIQAAYAAELCDEAPVSHTKIQSVALYLGTVFDELFYPLTNKNTKDAMCDLADALDEQGLKDFLLEEYETPGEDTPFTDAEISEETCSHLATRLEKTPEEVREYLCSEMDLHDSTKPYAVVAAASLIQSEPDLQARPLNAILKRVEERVLSYYQSWSGGWEKTAYGTIDSENPADARKQFEKGKAGQLVSALPVYIERYVEIDGSNFEQTYSKKQKLDQYSGDTQPHICLLCNDVLAGESDALTDYKTGKASAGISLGFTHKKKLSPEGGEPEQVVCPMCDLEMTLRNTVHKQSRKDSHYLMVAPDYFYSPADIRLQKHLRESWQLTGSELIQVGRTIIEGGSEDRANVLEDVLDVIYNTEQHSSPVMKNYDSVFEDDGALGVYRLDAPRKQDSSDEITDIPHAILDTYFSVLFSWVTSSRVLLTDTPSPTTKFEEFQDMVKTENMPAAIERALGRNSFSISYFKDLDGSDEWVERNFGNSQVGVEKNPLAGSNLIADGGVAVSSPSASQTSFDSFSLPDVPMFNADTEFGEAFYTLSAMLYLLPKGYDYNLQYLGRMAKELSTPFAGTKLVVKGNSNQKPPFYSELVAAEILDTFSATDEHQALQNVAEAGFDVVKPSWNGSNYEYERMYRAAIDGVYSLSDDAPLDDVEEAVAEHVFEAAVDMKEERGNQTRGIKSTATQHTRKASEKFASVFVSQVLERLCDGCRFELRRYEHEFGAGYNGAIRRHHHEWHEQYENLAA